ncbi:NO-inducible flavohemoprotein [Burkholderia glumae]|uniref:NO-inducible flavohemoprotein n=1 Tax=Burkholderia glumae TaxID=337 RepID=UPI00039B8F99|nr:NO-inducible flavohemoprotein [Burkholderia glumae]MCM2492114.1 NO-inducible flavohemoprotein [Burkholderia glumae]MCM2543111.1 NO-inducible flavohemoprotein [Burkholderia glumae]
MTTLTAEQMDRVKASAPMLAAEGPKIARHFYQRMFRRHPELRNLFNQSHQKAGGGQPEALARAVWAYAANIDNLGALGGAVSRIAHKHVSLSVRPEHYPIVGDNLLAAIVEVLGEAVDAPTLDAWRAAYAQLAQILTGVEARLYAQAPWTGYRPFRVARKQRESDEITSFYLTPTDGGVAPHFEPGQYVSVKRYIGALGVDQPRQYSLSDLPNGKWLRISVKREAGRGAELPAGQMSTLLHDGVEQGAIVEVSAPMGDFTLAREADTPVVLISGGVGITPMVSMASALAAAGSRRPLHFLHACRSGRAHAFRDWLNALVASRPNTTRQVLYETVGPNDEAGVDHDREGRLTPAELDAAMLPDADYYVCGPVGFMTAQRETLLARGVEPARVHTEIFGSGALA